jgi:hypothetical protein
MICDFLTAGLKFGRGKFYGSEDHGSVETCSLYENRRRLGVLCIGQNAEVVGGVSKDAPLQKGVLDFEALHGTMIHLFGHRISCRDDHTKAAVILYTPYENSLQQQIWPSALYPKYSPSKS